MRRRAAITFLVACSIGTTDWLRSSSRSRRFIFGGRSDTLTPPRQTLALWEHWGRPRLLQNRGGHVSYLVEREVRELLIEAFARTGLLDRDAPEAPAAG